MHLEKKKKISSPQMFSRNETGAKLSKGHVRKQAGKKWQLHGSRTPGVQGRDDLHSLSHTTRIPNHTMVVAMSSLEALIEKIQQFKMKMGIQTQQFCFRDYL